MIFLLLMFVNLDRHTDILIELSAVDLLSLFVLTYPTTRDFAKHLELSQNAPDSFVLLLTAKVMGKCNQVNYFTYQAV